MKKYLWQDLALAVALFVMACTSPAATNAPATPTTAAPGHALAPAMKGVPVQMGGDVHAGIRGSFLCFAARLPEPGGKILARSIGRNPVWEKDALESPPAWHPGESGLPLIDGAIATLECTVVETFSAGDHDLFIGRVDTLANEQHHPMPLLYYRRRYLRIEHAATAEVEGKPER